VTSHLRLVARIAMGYRRYGLPLSDLISEGNVGLLRAIKRFDPNKGARFSTYAIWWIKAEIQDYVLRSRSLVRMGTTSNQKRLFFNLSNAKRRLCAIHETDLGAHQVTLIANELGVVEKDVVEMNRRLSGDVSLNLPLNEDENPVEWQDRLVDEGSNQESGLAESEEAEIRRQALRQGLMALTDRERQIFEARRLIEMPLTLNELATTFRISRERIRQIENAALRKVQEVARAATAPRRVSIAAEGPPTRLPAIELGVSPSFRTQVGA
jgi:RNA polymerase sigma-32 factor